MQIHAVSQPYVGNFGFWKTAHWLSLQMFVEFTLVIKNEQVSRQILWTGRHKRKGINHAANKPRVQTRGSRTLFVRPKSSRTVAVRLCVYKHANNVWYQKQGFDQFNGTQRKKKASPSFCQFLICSIFQRNSNVAYIATNAIYLRWDWISISRRNWCSTPDFCSWRLLRTLRATIYFDWLVLARYTFPVVWGVEWSHDCKSYNIT